jgi:hypothetical protein
MEIDLAKRHQTMITLWFGLLASVGMYFLMTIFLRAKADDGLVYRPSSTLTLTLTALGFFIVVISFAVKRKLLNQSVEQQNLAAVQVAMIVACAMCEVSALLGLVVFFIFGSPEYYLLFFFAAAGMVLHFPRRSQLEAAQWSPLGSSTRPHYNDKES